LFGHGLQLNVIHIQVAIVFLQRNANQEKLDQIDKELTVSSNSASQIGKNNSIDEQISEPPEKRGKT